MSNVNLATAQTQIQNFLQDKIVAGSGLAMPKADILAGCGLPAYLEGPLTAWIKQGEIPGYEIRTGVGGGVGRAGEKPVRVKGAKAASAEKAPSYPREWLDKLQAVLDSNVPSGKNEKGNPLCLSRDKVAHLMGEPGSPCELKISKSIKFNLVQGFVSTAGRGGGIARASQVQESQPETQETTETSDEPEVEFTEAELTEDAQA